MDKETKDYIDNSLNEIIDSKFDKIIDRLLAVIVPASSACGSKASVSEPQQDPFANWQDTDIYPVWKHYTKPHTLENLEGIRVPVIDGTEILLYPKYKECALLPEDKIKYWSAKGQYNPLYADIDQHKATDELFSLGSKAAEHARQYGKDIALPTQLLAIAYYRGRINEISKILGGDLLSDIDSRWWSLLRYDADNAWCVHGANGTFYAYYMYYSSLCLPVLSVQEILKS